VGDLVAVGCALVRRSRILATLSRWAAGRADGALPSWVWRVATSRCKTPGILRVPFSVPARPASRGIVSANWQSPRRRQAGCDGIAAARYQRAHREQSPSVGGTPATTTTIQFGRKWLAATTSRAGFRVRINDLIERIRRIIDHHSKHDREGGVGVACGCGAEGLSDHSRDVAEEIVDRLGLRLDSISNVSNEIRYVSAWFADELTKLEGAE
jgi:hypothetical protein